MSSVFRKIKNSFGFRHTKNMRPVPDIPRINAKTFAPLRSSQGFSVDCDVDVCPGVVCLCPGNSPADVSRFVVSVVVDSIKRMVVGWSFTKAFKEVDKIIKSEKDSTTSPSWVALPVWFASLSSPFECPVLRRVSEPKRSLSFFLSAAAGLGSSPIQVAFNKGLDDAALAFTKPPMAAVRLAGITDRGEQAKLLASYVTKAMVVRLFNKIHACIVHARKLATLRRESMYQ